MWIDAGLGLGLPDVQGVEYILDWLSPDCLGWFRAAGMGGIESVDWREIEAFSRSTGLNMEPWEARQVRLMSVAYVAGHARGMQPMVASPMYENSPEDDPGLALERSRVADQIKRGFKGLAGG